MLRRRIVFVCLAGLIHCGLPSQSWASRGPGLHCERLLQLSKDRIRGLDEYDSYIFKWSTGEGRGDVMALLPTPDLKSYLLSQPSGFRWADVGAGYAIAMREMKRQHPEQSARMQFTAVDLFDWDQERDRKSEKLARELSGRDILHAHFKPSYVVGDMIGATPPQQNLITSIESIQYIEDKLGAIADWYNKLADNGLLIITAEHFWSREINVEGKDPFGDHVATIELIARLRAAGVQVAMMYQRQPFALRTLVVKKMPGSRLISLASPSRTYRNPRGYVFSYYTEPLIEVRAQQLEDSRD
jgi:hypothetical protein